MAVNTPETSLAIVRRFMNASGADKRNERCALLHDQCVVYAAGALPFSGEYHSPQGFFHLLAKMTEVLELTPGAIITQPLADDIVLARFPLTFTARSSGRSVEISVVELYTVRDGQIVELDVYYKDPSAVAALLAQ